MKTAPNSFTQPHTRKADDQGSILFMTIFVLLVLALVAMGFMYLLPTEMRSARHDRAVVQGGFATDAAVQQAMNILQASGGRVDAIPLGTAGRIDIGGGWSFQFEEAEDLGNLEVRVTVSAIANNKEMRRAVAIIDNSEFNPALNFTARDPDNPGNMTFAWPAHVPIKGDVLTNFLWTVNMSTFDASAGPSFDGTIYHVTDGTHDKGRHINGGLDPENYPQLYTQGYDAVQPFPQDASGLNAEDKRHTMITQMLGLDPDQTPNPDGLLSGFGVGNHVPNNNGVMDGGIYINRAGQGQGNQPGNVAIRFYLDAQGNSVMWVGDSDASVGAGNSAGGKGGKGGNNNNNNNNTTVQGQEFVFETVGAGGNPLPPEQHRLVVRNVESVGIPELILGTHNGVTNAPLHNSTDPNTPATPTGLVANPPIALGGSQVFTGANLAESVPIYVNGGIGSIQGVVKGSKTVGAATGVVITGEVLKSDVPRGVETTTVSGDVLGIIGGLNTNSPNTGMSFNIQGPVPSDNIINLYAHLMMTPRENGPTMMFNTPQQNQNTNPVDAGATVTLFGSFHVGQQVGGHAGQMMTFVHDNLSGVFLDSNTPFGFDNGGYVPRLRSYVEVSSAERRLDL